MTAEERQSLVLNARHMVANAGGDVARCAAQITRALAWQPRHDASLVADLETAIEAIGHAQRKLHEAVAELRVAGGNDD